MPRDDSLPTMLITEFDPVSSPPGIARRYKHVEEHILADGGAVETSSLNRQVASASGKVVRSLSAIIRRKSVAEDCAGRDVVVLGLGAPHMLLLAQYLSKRSRARSVVYDACDSWMLQLRARAATGKLKMIIPAAVGALATRFGSKELSTCYISNRDALADRVINGGRHTAILPPTYPAELDALEAVSGGISRIVISADYAAFHNAVGLADFYAAWPTFIRDHPQFRLDLYGVGWNGVMLPNATFHGWAESLNEIYQGNCAVFIPNHPGSGVPNKLLEARASRRPVIAHADLDYVLEDSGSAFSFGRGRTILQALSNLAELSNSSLPGRPA